MFVLQSASVLHFESLRMIFPHKSCSSLDGFLILFEIFQSCMKNYFQFILDWRQKTVNLLTNLPIKSSLISYPRFLSASISTFPFLDIKNIKMKRGFGTKQVQSKIILYIYYISQFYWPILYHWSLFLLPENIPHDVSREHRKRSMLWHRFNNYKMKVKL